MHCSSFRCLPLVVISAFVQCVAGDKNSNGKPPPNGDAGCEGFLANGTEPGYYARHMFFDFRNLTEHVSVPKVVVDESLATIAAPASNYFFSDEWASVWQLQGWNNSEGNANVYIQKNNDADASSETHLTLRTQRLPKFQSAAAFQSKTSTYQFLSLRTLARTIGSNGAVTAMFTYQDANSSSSVQEADVEFQTRGPREKIQYTNQPPFKDDGSVNQDATKNVTMPRGMIWSNWTIHRLDWTPQRSVWYVGGEEAANIEFQVPKDASGINFNAWSDGDSWSGNMSVYEEASLQIQWIEMIYNTTAGDDEQKGSVDRLWKRDLGPRGKLV